jgi:uncharacterized protein
MKNRLIVAAALLAFGAAAWAQTSGKKELVAKIISLQQPGIEGIARGLVEEPAAMLMQSAGAALQSRVAADKREAVGKAIQGEVKKYLDATAGPVRDRAIKLAPATIGPLLEEKFSEEELRQIAGWLEQPVSRKYQQLGPDMQRALAGKLVEEMRPTIEPKVSALEEAVAKHLGIPARAPAAAGAPARPAAAPSGSASAPTAASAPPKAKP